MSWVPERQSNMCKRRTSGCCAYVLSVRANRVTLLQLQTGSTFGIPSSGTGLSKLVMPGQHWQAAQPLHCSDIQPPSHLAKRLSLVPPCLLPGSACSAAPRAAAAHPGVVQQHSRGSPASINPSAADAVQVRGASRSCLYGALNPSASVVCDPPSGLSTPELQCRLVAEGVGAIELDGALQLA
jgi:hypothetical protein